MMFGVFGSSIIGVQGHTGAVSDSEERSARLVRHELQRGKPVLQDLGNDAGTRSLTFFFDETFCDPASELSKIERAWRGRTPMQLYFDLRGFEITSFLIERMTIDRQKTSPRGRMVRVEVSVELIESTASLGGGGLFGVITRAILNPLLKLK